jgi:ribonuclease R
VLGADSSPGGKPMLWLRSVDKRNRREWPVSDANGAAAGDLVLAKLAGRPPRQTAHVTERLGDPFAPRALSLIAIHKYDLPHVFNDETQAEAVAVSTLTLADPRREDLTHIPIVAIDPRDARDHDDAIWAAPDDDPANPGGFIAIVAIADVSFYVRAGSELDKEARKRGNSCYFPDQVIPMLPHILSSGVCSLKQDSDRAALACHLQIDRHGRIVRSRFTRARVRLAANIAYEDAQLAIDGAASPVPAAVVEGTLKPLWLAWKLLAKARDARSPLDLDLPERQVILDDKGRIAEIQIRDRLDAHRVVEDFMIAANVAAAKALEAKKSPCMYRVHEPPAREKLVALKEFLATYDVSFALGQVINPAVFNKLMVQFEEPEARQRMMEQMLRTQTQAYYSPVNAGHFGLALGSYGHFTSPIRRYADLLVHRALVSAYDLEVPKAGQANIPAMTGLSQADGAAFARTAEIISAAERRAMQAERETIDRYVAAYLSERIGDVMATRITGVQSFGFFAQVEGLGGDGLVPVSTLGREYFRWDEANQALIGEDSGTVFRSGQRLDLRLVDANPLTGSLAFALPNAEDGNGAPAGRTGRTRAAAGGGKSGGPGGRFGKGRRGRPANIRHQSR